MVVDKLRLREFFNEHYDENDVSQVFGRYHRFSQGKHELDESDEDYEVFIVAYRFLYLARSAHVHWEWM